MDTPPTTAPTDRVARGEATYTRLFGPRDPQAVEADPELMTILRRFVFGEVFEVGDLDDATRELITITVLTTNQTLPQLTAHTSAALAIGVTPVEIREAIYQCAPFLGFPKTLNAVAAANEAFRAHGIELPLPDQGTVTEETRYSAGLAIQGPLYGDEIAEGLAWLPDGLGATLARMLTEHGFGDFYTRGGLDEARRELLVLCLLAAHGDTPAQLTAHARGNVLAGNTLPTQFAALIHCFPYMGFPRTVNAIRALRVVADEG